MSDVVGKMVRVVTAFETDRTPGKRLGRLFAQFAQSITYDQCPWPRKESDHAERHTRGEG